MLLQLLSKLDAMEREKLELERAMDSRVEEAKHVHERALASAESRATALEEQLRSQSPDASGSIRAGKIGEPPAMAGPGRQMPYLSLNIFGYQVWQIVVQDHTILNYAAGQNEMSQAEHCCMPVSPWHPLFASPSAKSALCQALSKPVKSGVRASRVWPAQSLLHTEGYKWVLRREDEEPPSTSQPDPVPHASIRSSLARATAPELERLQDVLQQKEEQVAACQASISKLEATRDR